MAKFVRELMKKTLIEVHYNDSVQIAVDLMTKKKVHSVLVKPKRGSPLQIFTDTDALLAIDGDGRDLSAIPVHKYASTVDFFADPDWTVETAARKMVEHGVKHLPVKGSFNRVIGMISSTDVINYYK